MLPLPINCCNPSEARNNNSLEVRLGVGIEGGCNVIGGGYLIVNPNGDGCVVVVVGGGGNASC